MLLVFSGCGDSAVNGGKPLTDAPAQEPLNGPSQGPAPKGSPHRRQIETPTYSGNRGAIIFSVNHIEDKSLYGVTDRIIRVFAEKEIPVDIAIYELAPGGQKGAFNFLMPFVDAGLIDLSVDGAEISWLDTDTPNVENAYVVLKSHLAGQVSFIGGVFGSVPAACVFPYEEFNEYNYRVLQDTGFSIISSEEKGSFTSSRQPVTWSGQADSRGLYRLPVVVEASFLTVNPLIEAKPTVIIDENKQYLKRISENIKSFGVSVVSIQPRSFTTADGKVDNNKLKQLSELIRQSTQYGEIVTFNGWMRYAANYIGVKQTKSRVLPPYNGGPTVIFRLDDVSKGWHEDADKALIEVFKSNGVPLDCGVISNVSGTNSYELSWLKQYSDEGSVGISVHGFDWTYYQLDTTKSGLTYEQIKFKLQKARDQFLNYYGVAPVAITVPTDFYDQNGYKAVEDAGFKIFATQIAVEPHPSTVPVDFDGHKDPNGMYRLPTACDVSIWENDRFTDVYDVSKLAKVTDYCKYYQALSTTMTDDKFGYMVCSEMGMLNVAVISLHPSAFVASNGKLDQSRIDKVDAIIKWVKTFAAVTTFEQWYNFHSGKK